MFSLIPAVVTAVFQMMDLTMFFGHAFLFVAGVSSVGLMVKAIRSLIVR